MDEGGAQSSLLLDERSGAGGSNGAGGTGWGSVCRLKG